MKQTINQICKSFNQNWELSAEGKEQWILSFVCKTKFKNTSQELIMNKLQQFYQTDLSEKSFKDCFDGLIQSMPKYDSPNNYKKQLKTEEINKIANKLSASFNISQDQATFFTKRMYYKYSQDQWSADVLLSIIEKYDPELLTAILYPHMALKAA